MEKVDYGKMQYQQEWGSARMQHSTIDMIVGSSLSKAKDIKAIKESKRNILKPVDGLSKYINRIIHRFDFELSMYR